MPAASFNNSCKLTFTFDQTDRAKNVINVCKNIIKPDN